MAITKSTITIHMVSSLDGFIASKDGSISWMNSNDHYENGITLTEEDVRAFVERIDCYVIGSHTYEHALELGWPYGDKPVIVLSSRNLESNRSQVTFYSGSIQELVNDKLESYQKVWVAGGSKLAGDFIRLQLADEIIISIMPVILGEGIPFFDQIGQKQLLHLENVTAYQDGMVELSYEVKRRQVTG